MTVYLATNRDRWGTPPVSFKEGDLTEVNQPFSRNITNSSYRYIIVVNDKSQ